ncbi:uncharacterized protein F5Z01DRAFT_644722 [Emericellopsis atlantica]|uniref:mRNA splicing factor RNA helicase n=1 Tax=Emericellopsis atlantica TaxID=2614577 RepID=A0A9P7ZUB6_9HYPO|nr:uncharacterized protein F5Z01DRAFT_644722 [Emericellopsis atlantica]KAG9257961.1 hypothetical protein F5Z01DRAFT_644722 [Emericellopsis atlantica]
MSEPAFSTIRFRPSKKRKYRQRAPDEDDSGDTQPAPPTQRASAADFFQDGQADEADRVVKARARARLRGVKFRATTQPEGDEPSQALVLRGEDSDVVPVAGIADRFTRQTGLTQALDDRHLNNFIESRLANRNTSPKPASPPEPTATAEVASQASAARQVHISSEVQEVDIPTIPEIPSRTQPAERPEKVKLGPDGKPWRGGRRKRRGSDDIARDKLVEELLHENRLDVYSMPTSEAAAASEGEEGDADERLAAQFQQQYMEDMARKQAKKKKPVAAGQQGQAAAAGAEEVLKGPKLGGSRNARSAVRDMLLRKEKEGKK